MAEAWSTPFARVWNTPKWKSSEKVVPYLGLRGDTVLSLELSIALGILIKNLALILLTSVMESVLRTTSKKESPLPAFLFLSCEDEQSFG
jgi:hypothetical protein